MTGEQFREWLSAMNLSGVEAAQLLGVTQNTITRYRRDGGPRMLDLACAELLTARNRKTQKASRAARAREKRQDESRPFRLGAFKAGLEWDNSQEPCLILDERVGSRFATYLVRRINRDGSLNAEQWYEQVWVRDLDNEEGKKLLASFKSKPWAQRLAGREGLGQS